MYRINEIVESFKTLVGWEQSHSNQYKIDEELTTSDSGLYFQEAHPMLTLRAMNNIMPQDWLDRYDDFVLGETYAKGKIVKSQGKAYKSLIDDNEEPLTNKDAWGVYNVLNDYLIDLRTRGIKKVVQRFIQDKIIGLESKTIIDRKTLFDGVGRVANRVENKGKLVGFEITPLRSEGVTTTINKVGLQFVGNVGEIKLYLFHSSKSEPIATKVVDYTSDRGSFLWYDLTNWVLPYVNDSINAGGSWYVVYDQNALPNYMEAVNFGRDWSREPCGTCNKGDALLYRTMAKYVNLSPFYVAIGENWDEHLWDVESNMYCNGNNFGLNFQISMDCDLTNTILGERLSFANVVQLQVAHEALRTLALNPEVSVNRVQANADRDNILYETDGNGQGIRGLKGELDKAYKALSIDTKGLDPICLGCHNNGIHYKSI